MKTIYKTSISKLYALAALLATLTFSFGQTAKLHSIFDQYQNTEGVTSIKIAKPMFRMLGGMNINDSDLKQISPILNKVDGLKILIVEGGDKENTAKTKNFQAKLKNEIFAAVKNLNYEELMTVKSKDNNIKFLAEKTGGDFFNNLLLTINADDNDILMILDGKISMNDINNLVNETQNRTDDTTESPFSEIRNVGSFNSVDISSGIFATLEQSNNQKVTVETDAGKQQFVKTVVQNGTLKVFVEKSPGVKNFKKLNVKIAVPNITAITVTQGAKLETANTINSRNLAINLESGSNLTGNFNVDDLLNVKQNSGSNGKFKINVGELNYIAKSGSNTRFEGSAQKTTIKISSGSNINAEKLIAQNVMVDADFAANAKVYATDELTIKTSSGSTVQYEGQPKTKKLTPSPGSTITQKK